jgi:hypothetical protein
VGLIPNPNDVFKKVDNTVENAEVILGRTDLTLSNVAATLVTVDGSLEDVGGTLAEVRALLGELRGHLQLLEAVPALAAQLEEVHAIVSRLAPTA